MITTHFMHEAMSLYISATVESPTRDTQPHGAGVSTLTTLKLGHGVTLETGEAGGCDTGLATYPLQVTAFHSNCII